jgi:HEAT repeat protein
MSIKASPTVVALLFWNLAVRGQNEPLKPLADVLQQHHIATTKTALMDALRNREPEVRWIAAQKLAEDNVKEAIPSIRDALRRDRQLPESEINIAAALAELGAPDGFAKLNAMCDDATLAPNLRIASAKYLVNLGKSGCLDSTLAILKTQTSDDIGIDALQLLPRLAGKSEAERHRVATTVVEFLLDKSPSMRLNAAIALADIGDASIVPDLKGAIAKEKEDAIRSQMQATLRKLEGRPQ